MRMSHCLTFLYSVNEYEILFLSQFTPIYNNATLYYYLFGTLEVFWKILDTASFC